MSTGLTVKQKILNIIADQPKGYAGILAKIAGYSSGSALTKVLTDPDREFENKFNGFVELVKSVFGDEEKSIMEQYSREIDPKNRSAQIMLEYLSSHKLLDSLNELIEKMLQCNNKKSKEYAKLYTIQLEWSRNYYHLDIMSILKMLNDFKTENLELVTLIDIMKCNSFYKQKLYKSSFEVSMSIRDSIENIKDDFIKAAYSIKYNEIMSYLSLRVLNDPEQARKHSEKVLELNIGQTFNAYAKYIIGYSYLFTSYDKAKESLNESMKIYNELNREASAIDIKEELELLDILWDKDIFSVYYDKRYKYYWMIRNNKELNIDNLDIDSDDPFYFLIKGMKANDTNLLLQSLIRFVKRGDMFLGNIPKIELQKRGFSEDVINDLLQFYV